MKDYPTEGIRRPGSVGKETIQGGVMLPTGRLGGALNDPADAVPSWASNPAGYQRNEVCKAGLSETPVEAQKEHPDAIRNRFEHPFPPTSSLAFFFCSGPAGYQASPANSARRRR